MPSVKVTLHRVHNHCVVTPTTPRLLRVLKPALTGVYTERLSPREAKRQGVKYLIHREALYWLDAKRRLCTTAAFTPKIHQSLKQAGYEVYYKRWTYPEHPEAYEPDWDAVWDTYDLRWMQDQVLLKLCVEDFGVIKCPPAYGKTTMQCAVALLFPKARIDYVCARTSVLRDIYRELVGLGVDVGIISSAKRANPQARVRAYTPRSLTQGVFDADIVLADEVHLLAADSYSALLARYRHAKMFGFSASPERADGKHARIEALFGQRLIDISTAEATRRGLVAPVEVHWRVVDGRDVGAGIENDTTFARRAIWTNKFRNQIIAEDARSYGEDVQRLIVVSTTEHAMHLKRLLPEFELAYAGGTLSEEDRRRYVAMGCISEDEPRMNAQRLDMLQRQFAAKKLRKAIATTVWDTGVDFRHLDVLIRADAGSSPIKDTQLPGRAMRTSAGKEVGIVRDYVDVFNQRTYRRSLGRRRSYEQHGWIQHWPEEELRRRARRAAGPAGPGRADSLHPEDAGVSG